MKHNKNTLHLINIFLTLGKSVMGIFFPFFLAQAFDLNGIQTTFLLSGIAFLMGTLSFLINFFGTRFLGMRQLIEMGLLSQAIFFIVLAFFPHTIAFLFLASLLFSLHAAFFFPAFHYAALHSTQDGTRGNFFGNFQVILISANLIAPLISGFLLEYGQEKYLLIFSLFCFFLAFFFGRKIENLQISINNTTFHFQEFFLGKKKWAFFADALQTGTMMFLWPLYFKAIIGKFSLMGGLISLSAFFEVIASKWLGRLTDSKSPIKMLQTGVWLRCIDLGQRVFFILFQNPIFVSAVMVFGAVLGPFFQIPLSTRLYDIAEHHKESVFTFFVIRELHLGIIRGLIVFFGGISVYFFGTLSLGFILLLAGFSSFFFRKF